MMFRRFSTTTIGEAAVPVGEDGSAQGGGTSDGLPPDPCCRTQRSWGGDTLPTYYLWLESCFLLLVQQCPKIMILPKGNDLKLVLVLHLILSVPTLPDPLTIPLAAPLSLT